jgi:hypothetical protein
MKANPNCRECYGTGTVYDWVPYGIGSITMPSQCDCVVASCPCCNNPDTTCIKADCDDLTETWYCNLCNCDFEVVI